MRADTVSDIRRAGSALLLACAAACGGQATTDAAVSPLPAANRGAVLVPEGDAQTLGVGPPTRGRGFALVVGIDRYESLTKLGAAVADALAVQTRLEAAGYRVTLLRDEGATRKEIMSALIDQLPKDLTPDDSLLVYFAGHGESVGSPQQRMGYLMPVDAEQDRPGGTGIAMAELQTVLAGLPSRHVMFLADACYSGLALNLPTDNVPDTGGDALSYVERLRQRRVRFTLVAGSDDEQAMELDGQGVFTRFFLAGIDGAADQDQNFVVTSDEVYTFVKSRVQAEVQRRFQASQIPQMARSGQGEFLFELQRGAGSAVASASCDAGRSQSPDTQGHCCWYGQAWSSVRSACVGRPDCPSGMIAQGESCTPTAPAPATGLAQAALRYQQGCDAGNARDCSDLAVLTEAGIQGVAKDPTRALALHKRGCDAGDGVACRRLALVYAEQSGAEARAKSVKCAQKACDAADGRGCQWLAKTLIASAATPANLSRAASLLKTSCDSGYGAGCELLGQLHEQGKGVAQDPKLALDLYAKACDSKDGRCRELARVYTAGTLVQPDLTKAAGYAKTACDGGDTLGCARLADALEAGKGVPKNLAGAKQLRVRACIDGVGDACAKAIQKAPDAVVAPPAEHDAGAQRSDAGVRPVLVLTPALRAVSPAVAAESVRTVQLQREALQVLAKDCAQDKTQPGCEQLPAAEQPKTVKPQIVIENVLERAPSKPALTPLAPRLRGP